MKNLRQREWTCDACDLYMKAAACHEGKPECQACGEPGPTSPQSAPVSLASDSEGSASRERSESPATSIPRQLTDKEETPDSSEPMLPAIKKDLKAWCEHVPSKAEVYDTLMLIPWRSPDERLNVLPQGVTEIEAS